jgi:hypothetical protein
MCMIEGVEVELTFDLKHDLETFFQRKYGPLSFQYHHFIPQDKDTAKVDLTINGQNNFTRRYVGAISYVDSHLSTHALVRLW